ncbi:MAG: protein kinase [bacterium]|nr:protein kinase [bacterium]
MKKLEKIEAFDFNPGRELLRKYRIKKLLGGGWEGEVYLVQELATGIERAAKFFFPHRNPKDSTLKYYAKKLHKLRHCPVIIRYNTQESITFRRQRVTFLVSEFVEGELLCDFVARHRGRRLTPFRALHLLHALAEGLESVHALGEYHGDLHWENIIVQQYGLGFDIKLIDFFHWKEYPKPVNIRDDVVDLVKLLYDCIGGKKHYKNAPPEVKKIICGLKRSMILKKFRTAGQLKEYLENMEWN